MTRERFIEQAKNDYGDNVFDLNPWLLDNFDGKETWKDVVGWEGDYVVSTTGRVKKVNRLTTAKYKRRTKSNELEITSTLSNGYLKVSLRNKNKRQSISLHRLIAQAFVPNPHNSPTVNHKNGVRTNNYLQNLEWLSGSENTKHAHETGIVNNVGVNNKRAKLSNAQVIEIKASKLSIKQLSNIYCISESNISEIRSGKKWKHLNQATC